MRVCACHKCSAWFSDPVKHAKKMHQMGILEIDAFVVAHEDAWFDINVGGGRDSESMKKEVRS